METIVIPQLEGATPGWSGIAYFVLFLEKWFPIFLLVMARTFGLTSQAPFFSDKSLPAQGRATFVVSLTMMYMITFQPEIENLPDNYILFSLLMVKEFLAGVLFGFCASITLSAIQAAGELIDVQMGLSMVMLLNPATKTQSSAVGRLFFQMASVIFVMTDGHLYLLTAFFQTFELIPLGKFSFSNPESLGQFFKIMGQLFALAAKLAMPVLVVLFIIDFSLGITNRVSPQINVLELNFAMKPTTGMIVVLVILSTLVSEISRYTDHMIKDSTLMMKTISVQINKDSNKKKE